MMPDTPIASLADRLIRALAPSWALRREQARRVLAYYEAARPDRQRKARRESGTGSQAVRQGSLSIREQARHLEQNSDLARAVLRVMVNNTIGAAGIQVEPTPLDAAGQVDTLTAAAILEIWEEWGEAPEVTRQLSWPKVQRLLARSKFRDGEALCRMLGPAAPVRHAGALPLSLELLEADFLPLGHDSEFQGRSVRDGIELNAWGQPMAYWLYRGHPGEIGDLRVPWSTLSRISAEDVLHLAQRDRLHQRRGMSDFASILERLDHLKDYETSETVAAKVAASMGAAIKKGTPDLYNAEGTDADGEPLPRDLMFRAGMIFDDLQPGESIEMIGNNGRPNSGLLGFRSALLKAATAGVGVSHSSVSREYDGSYSARRQELVDSWVDYAVLSQDLAAELVRPIYRRVVATAVATGRLRLPPGMPLARAVQAMYVTPQMPWVDPAKEASAWETLLGSGLASGPEVVRKRGRSPTDVQREEMQWRRQWREADESLAYLAPVAASAESMPEPDDDPDEPPELDEDDEEANASRQPRRSLHAVR
jgi:lambda family phage portal protein